MNVIVVAVDVGKCPALLRCSFLTKQKEPLPKCFRWSLISLNPGPAIGINGGSHTLPPFFTPDFSIGPFFFFLPTSFHHIFKGQSVLPFSHSSISSPPTALKAPLALSNRSPANSPSPLFSSLHPRSVSIFPSRPLLWDGCSTNWDLLKMSFLTGWAGHSAALLIYPSSVLQ